MAVVGFIYLNGIYPNLNLTDSYLQHFLLGQDNFSENFAKDPGSNRLINSNKKNIELFLLNFTTK